MSTPSAPTPALGDPLDADAWQALSERSRRVARAQWRWMLPVLAGLTLFTAAMFGGVVTPTVHVEEQSGSGEMTSPGHWRYTLVETVHNVGWTPVELTMPASTSSPHVRVVDVQSGGRIPGFGTRDVSIVMEITGCDAPTHSTDEAPMLQVTGHTLFGARTISRPNSAGLADAREIGCRR